MLHGGPGGTPGGTGSGPVGFSAGGGSASSVVSSGSGGAGTASGSLADYGAFSGAGGFAGAAGEKATFRPHLCREWLDTAGAILAGSVCLPPAQKPDLLALFRHSRSWCRGAVAGTCTAAHGVQEMQLPTAGQFDAMVRASSSMMSTRRRAALCMLTSSSVATCHPLIYCSYSFPHSTRTIS